MALTKKEREIIKEKLPHGSLAIIAKSLGYSRMTVSFYFSGRNNNNAIEDKAVELYLQEIKRENKLKKAFKNA